PEGARRFILSLRATGEGHISSIVFRSGSITKSGRIRLDEPGRYVAPPDQVPNPQYEKALFARKLFELGVSDRFGEHVLAGFGEYFTLTELEAAVERQLRQGRASQQEHTSTAKAILTLARSNYEIAYVPEQPLSERVIFPSGPTETNGIEDARFVRFTHDDGQVVYYATYTAYDGRV